MTAILINSRFISSLFGALALLAVFFVPVDARASALYSQLGNEIQYPAQQVFQGLGTGLFTSTTTVTNIGMQFWTTQTNANVGLMTWCIIEYNSRSDFENNHNGAQLPNSVCYGTAGNADYITDSQGFVSTSTNQSYTFAPFKYYAIQAGGASKIWIGSNAQFNFQNVVLDSASTTQATSLYFQFFSGSTAVPFYTPNPNFAGFATTSLGVFCEPPSNILDVGGGVRYGLCTAGSFLFVPNQTTVSQWTNLSSMASERIPFSYFYQLTSIYDNLIATTSPSFIDVEFDISSTSVASTGFGSFVPAVVAFSTSTVGTYIPSNVLAILRTLMSATIWLGFAYYAYRRIPGLLHKST